VRGAEQDVFPGCGEKEGELCLIRAGLLLSCEIICYLMFLHNTISALPVASRAPSKTQQRSAADCRKEVQ